MLTPEAPVAGGARYACRRCEDWTTIVVETTEAPCPACRSEDYKTWLDAGNKLPRLDAEPTGARPTRT